jgi:hypothetical protein
MPVAKVFSIRPLGRWKMKWDGNIELEFRTVGGGSHCPWGVSLDMFLCWQSQSSEFYEKKTV